MLDRHQKIIDLINQEERVEVKELAKRMGVSAVTIRKDLEYLAGKSLLVKEHGYAEKYRDEDQTNRFSLQYDLKLKIAKKAAGLVRNGEVVMIESGSTCALLADEIASSGRDITVITNSAFIASFISGKGDSRVILLGGEYQKESRVMVGPLVRVCAKTFHVDKLFAGADGFDMEYGFTAGDLMRTDAIKAMAEAARHTIVLADSTKFEQLGLVMQLPFEAVASVVTDGGISAEAVSAMKAHGVEVLIAE
ncbi:MAG: DeoR/GlpR transcriptional regulator [Lachnospiraceae bacterium]|nr:DeoR/GlpR transcriptional regulator [Lachnospiraceae bacterium]